MKPTLKQWLQVAKNFIIELPLEILAFFVVPIALLFAKESDDHLLRCFRWFEDADDFYDGQSAAINGDGGWRRDHFPPPKNRTYFARLCWLLRNRIGYFCVKYLGVKTSQIDPTSIKTFGDPSVTSNGGKASSQGLELEAAYYADNGLDFSASLGVNKTKYKQNETPGAKGKKIEKQIEKSKKFS